MATIMQDLFEAFALRVLVVDDYRDAADSLAQLCRLWGHDVRVAYDGEQALRLARAHRPRVALLDLAMPGMDGVRVAQRLRRAELRDACVLVCVSGYRGAHIDRLVAQAGYDHFFTKPADPAELQRLLTSIGASVAADCAGAGRSKATA
jgi:CheY-like chemotaxis protein